MFIYFWERDRETEHEWGRGRERGRHRIRSRLEALSCQHRAWHGARTHELWDHDLSRSQTLKQLSHPGAPVFNYFRFHIQVRSCSICLPVSGLFHLALCPPQLFLSIQLLLLKIKWSLTLSSLNHSLWNVRWIKIHLFWSYCNLVVISNRSPKSPQNL